MHSKTANMDISQVFTKEFLEKECSYKPNKQIAKENNCAMSTVRKYLKKYNLCCYNPTNIGGHSYIKVWEKDCSRYIANRDNKDKILKRRYHNVIENYIRRSIDCSHEVVHHLNRDSKDDRLENLVLMEKKDHDRLHLILRNKKQKACTLNELIDYLFKKESDNELKRYAELTRIIPSTESVRNSR